MATAYVVVSADCGLPLLTAITPSTTPTIVFLSVGDIEHKSRPNKCEVPCTPPAEVLSRSHHVLHWALWEEWEGEPGPGLACTHVQHTAPVDPRLS
jgi:hypothetical protein